VEKGWHHGESTCLPLVDVAQVLGPGLILAWYHMWVAYVVDSRLVPRVFSLGSPVFLPPQKPTSLNP